MGYWLIFCAILAFALASNDDVGTFWLVNDPHFQWNYVEGSNPKKACLEGTGDAGKYGHISCSACEPMLQSAFDFMKKVDPNPDFFSYLGDVAPQNTGIKHIHWDKYVLIELLANWTDLVRKAFPSTPFFPILGNHDVIPVNRFAPKNNWVLDDSYKIWKSFIPESQKANYLKGGYYRVDINEKLTFLMINTAYYFTTDWDTLLLKDPVDQFQWLKDEMQRLVDEDRYAMIFGHVPPGMTESVATPVPHMQPQFSSKFLDSLAVGLEHKRVSSTFFGHAHTQAFRILWDYKNDLPGAPVFISPSLVAYALSIVVGNNPGIRHYTYNRTTGVVLNYQTYWLNLTEANIEKKAEWKLEHDARDLFNIPDFSAKGAYRAYENLSKNTGMLKEYIKYNTVGIPNSGYSKVALNRHLCSIRHCRPSDFYLCYV